MKKLVVFFSLAFIMFFTNCTENFSTDPNLPNTAKQEDLKDIINICCLVQDPYSGACGLNGSIIYTHELLDNPNPFMENNLHKVKVTLDVNATLCDRLGIVHLNWGIRGESEDILFVSEEGIRLLEKRYEVSNRSDIQIKAVYLITTEGVGLSSMNVVQIPGNYYPVYVNE